MKKSKILIRNKSRLQSTESFIKEYEQKLDEYLNVGYEIKTSNLIAEGNFSYIYTLLEKEV